MSFRKITSLKPKSRIHFSINELLKLFTKEFLFYFKKKTKVYTLHMSMNYYALNMYYLNYIILFVPFI